MGLHPLVSLPTRITSKSATLIDNIFTNDLLRNASSGIIFTSISEHLPNFALLGDAGVNPDKGPQYANRRDMGLQNKEKFRKWVNNWGKNFIPGRDSVVQDVYEFRNEFRDEYNIYFPLKKVRINRRDRLKPWLNDGLLLGKIKERNRLHALSPKGFRKVGLGYD